MAPSSTTDTDVPRRHVGPRGCPCLQRPYSNGLCELSVWQGTAIEHDPRALSRHKLLHRDMQVVKYRDLRLGSLSGCMHFMVMLNWLPLLALFIGLYIAVTGIFALFFAICGTDLSDRKSTPRDYFNFSVQTMATIGYGELFPKDSCSNWVAVVESFVAMILVSLLTGIAFVKYARPRSQSQIIFSKIFTISQREEGPDAGLGMQFRIVNGTRRKLIMKGEILEVNFKLTLMRIEETKTGEKKLCCYDLHLKTTSFISLRLEADIIHEIGEDSPFYGMTKEDIAQSDFLLILTMSGVDEVLHDTVYERFEYTHEHMRWGAKFVPVLSWDQEANQIELDFDQISATVPAPTGEAREQDAQIVVEKTNNGATLSTETEGNMDTADELEYQFETVSDRPPQFETVSDRPHTQEVNHTGPDQPMSLMRRHVRFKNHPVSRFSKTFYYRALETSWFRLFVYFSLMYFSAIAIMAGLMHLTARHAVIDTAGVEVPLNYERMFFFCAQTITMIGYGSLAPKPDSDLVNFYVCVLAIAGVIVSTLITGLAWAKFSIPKASTIAFSDHILLTTFHSHRAIMFRAANSRTYGAVVEGSFRVSVAILNQGIDRKETHELKLVRNVWPVVRLATTVTHIIDENSPLYHIPTDELLSGRHFFAVLFSGLDPVVGENLFSRKTYHSCDVLVGHHFVDNIKIASDGIHVDLEAINDTAPTTELGSRESRLRDASADTGTTASIEPPQEVGTVRGYGQVVSIEPDESKRRGRRSADAYESIDTTPRAAQYAPM